MIIFKGSLQWHPPPPQRFLRLPRRHAEVLLPLRLAPQRHYCEAEKRYLLGVRTPERRASVRQAAAKQGKEGTARRRPARRVCRHRPLLRHPAAERAQSVSRRRPTTPRQPTPLPRSHGRAPRSSSGKENVRADGRRTPVQSSHRLFTKARRRALALALLYA